MKSRALQPQPEPEQRSFTVMPPTYFLLALVLQVGTHVVFPVFTWNSTIGEICGILLAAVGAVLVLWADALFKRQNTTVKPDQTPSRLVINGPFRVSRHPIYLGMVLILMGVGLWLESVMAMVWPAVLGIMLEVVFVSHEERILAGAFGVDYESYRREVRRWI